MRTVAVVNLKGGSGKTTSAVFLAHEWAARGRRVLLVDADPQGTALRWSEQAAFSAGIPPGGPYAAVVSELDRVEAAA